MSEDTDIAAAIVEGLPPSAEVEKLHLALGRFVSIFSGIEANLQNTLWHFAGVPSPLAQAVFSGIRIEGAISYINRIADAQKWTNERKADTEYIFSQLGKINKLRNDVLHYGATFNGPNNWRVSNAVFAHTPDRIREINISPETLDEASHDLGMIHIHLICFAFGEILPEESLAYLNSVRSGAWRYKQPQQDRPGHKRRKIPRKPRRQRNASHE